MMRACIWWHNNVLAGTRHTLSAMVLVGEVTSLTLLRGR